MPSYLSMLLAFAAPALPACYGDNLETAHEQGNEAVGHSHEAPHAAAGGMLVELGDHLAQMEVLPDFETGELRLFFWDGHAESPVRLTQTTLKLTVTVGEASFNLLLAARASSLTGETVGDSSEFLGVEERLRGARGFTAVAQRLDVLGSSFESVPITYSQGDH